MIIILVEVISYVTRRGLFIEKGSEFFNIK